MLLAINSGNTNTVFALFEGDAIKGVWKAAANAKRTADEYAVWLTQLMALEGYRREDVDAVIVSNVVPAVAFNLKTLCRKYFHAEPMFIGEDGVELGIKVLLDRPEEVGADRVVNAIAGKARFGAPLIVVDIGTATTFDVVDAEGNYCGGAIAPGINLSLQALEMAAAKLPHVAIRRVEKVIGRSTIPAMQSGLFWGYVGLIEGLVGRIRAEFGAPMRVIATGGLAPLFEGATSVIEAIDPDLTLWGLRLIHQRNKQDNKKA
jgi:type III pantothenate kinase